MKTMNIFIETSEDMAADCDLWRQTLKIYMKNGQKAL
jgi:hypothetical protein